MGFILTQLSATAGIAVFAWLFWGTFKHVGESERSVSFVAVGLFTWAFAIVVCALALVARL